LESLFDISTKLIAGYPNWFVKVEAHDINDPGGADLLWLALIDGHMLEGEVLHVSPLKDGRWDAGHDLVLETGNPATLWSFDGSEDEVLHAIAMYLSTEMRSVRFRFNGKAGQVGLPSNSELES
jgi:hypothetical protein